MSEIISKLEVIRKILNEKRKDLKKPKILNDIDKTEQSIIDFFNITQTRVVSPKDVIIKLPENSGLDANKINKKIDSLDERFIKSQNYYQLKLFLQYVDSIMRDINKLRNKTLRNIFNIQRGGDNSKLIEQLERDISDLESLIIEYIDTVESDCTEIYEMSKKQMTSFTYYKNTIDKLKELSQNIPDLKKELDSEFYKNLEKFFNGNFIGEDMNPKDKKDCKIIRERHNEFNSLFENFSKVSELYEDYSGAVRVYFRFNNITDTKIPPKLLSIDYSTKTISSGDDKLAGVYAIYNNISNEQMYLNPPEDQPNLKGVFDLLRLGYSNLIFGYGFSGSGKTYSLFGKKAVHRGIVQYGFDDLLKNGYEINLEYAFDIYGQINYSLAKGLTVDSELTFYTKNIPDGLPKIKKNDKKLTETRLTNDNLVNIIDKLTDIRKENGHIKATINNPESSRGHLFLVFRVSKGDLNSYMTVVDMAGIEDPKTIISQYFAESNSFSSIFNYISSGTGKPVWIDPKITKDEKENVKNIIKEGFFINETIHQLFFYLLSVKDTLKNFNHHEQEGMTKERGLIRIRAEKYSNENLFFYENGKITNKENILIVPVINFITSLSEVSSSKSKYIMLGVVRSDRIEGTPKRIKFLDKTMNFVRQLTAT